MEFLNYLINEFGYNQAIIFNKISFKDYSKIWIKKTLCSLCKEKKITRFKKGIYYISSNSEINTSNFDVFKIIEKKYLDNNGYYSGISFMYHIGLSIQVPHTIEIYTNNASNNIRKVNIGYTPIVIRKARVEVNKDNVAILSLLELMNFVSNNYFNNGKRKEIISSYIKENKLTRNDVKKYAPYFPSKAIRNLIESDAIYLFA